MSTNGNNQGSLESTEIEDVKRKILDMKIKQAKFDASLSSLKREKKELEALFPPANSPSSEIASHYSYIYPLVKEIHLLELKEKELIEDYNDKIVCTEARQIGAEFLSASLDKEEVVLKKWYEELKEMQNSQPAISTTSVESQEFSTVHNVTYNFCYDWKRLIEELAVTILYQAVHCRIKIHSVSSLPNFHSFAEDRADVSVRCDTYIPTLEKTVIELLESNSSVKEVISKISEYISSDMAPFVISIPIRKKSKKKKKDIIDTPYPESSQDHSEGKVELVQDMKSYENT